MPVNHWKGIPLPEAGDDLLSAWPRAFDAAGVIFPAQSVAEAREILARAEAAGHPPTAAHPVYVDVNGIIYRSNGAKAADRWALSPVNEAQVAEGSIGESHQWGLSAYQRADAATADLGVRPYDRIIHATFTAWGQVVSGVVDAHLTIGPRNFVARFPSSANGASVTVVGMAVVPAGQNPSVRAGFTGGGSGGVFNFTSNQQYSGLIATATPKGMQ